MDKNLGEEKTRKSGCSMERSIQEEIYIKALSWN